MRQRSGPGQVPLRVKAKVQLQRLTRTGTQPGMAPLPSVTCACTPACEAPTGCRRLVGCIVEWPRIFVLHRSQKERDCCRRAPTTTSTRAPHGITNLPGRAPLVQACGHFRCHQVDAGVRGDMPYAEAALHVTSLYSHQLLGLVCAWVYSHTVFTANPTSPCQSPQPPRRRRRRRRSPRRVHPTPTMRPMPQSK